MIEGKEYKEICNRLKIYDPGFGTFTVGELIDELSKYKRELPVFIGTSKVYASKAIIDVNHDTEMGVEYVGIEEDRWSKY